MHLAQRSESTAQRSESLASRSESPAQRNESAALRNESTLHRNESKTQRSESEVFRSGLVAQRNMFSRFLSVLIKKQTLVVSVFKCLINTSMILAQEGFFLIRFF